MPPRLPRCADKCRPHGSIVAEGVLATARTYRPRPRGQIRSISILCVPEPAATPVAVCVRQFRTGWGMQSNATPRWAESTTAAVDAAAIGHLSGSGLALAVLAGTRRFRTQTRVNPRRNSEWAHARKRVGTGKSGPVRVELGGVGNITKKRTNR